MSGLVPTDLVVSQVSQYSSHPWNIFVYSFQDGMVARWIILSLKSMWKCRNEKINSKMHMLGLSLKQW